MPDLRVGVRAIDARRSVRPPQLTSTLVRRAVSVVQWTTAAAGRRKQSLEWRSTRCMRRRCRLSELRPVSRPQGEWLWGWGWRSLRGRPGLSGSAAVEAGDEMVDGSFRRRRLRPLGLLSPEPPFRLEGAPRKPSLTPDGVSDGALARSR